MNKSVEQHTLTNVDIRLHARPRGSNRHVWKIVRSDVYCFMIALASTTHAVIHGESIWAMACWAIGKTVNNRIDFFSHAFSSQCNNNHKINSSSQTPKLREGREMFSFSFFRFIFCRLCIPRIVFPKITGTIITRDDEMFGNFSVRIAQNNKHLFGREIAYKHWRITIMWILKSILNSRTHESSTIISNLVQCLEILLLFVGFFFFKSQNLNQANCLRQWQQQ